VASSDLATVLRWSANELRALREDAAPALLAADSWLVADGRVRGHDLHWARFAGWCGALEVPAAELAGFRAAVTAALPRSGRWFPRVEVVRSGGARALQLRERPARPGAHTARVIVGPPGDPRARPCWKGPDVELLLALRERAVAGGADELLLCDGEGRLVEGALDSLLWWQGDTLCTTPGDRTLPGVTRALLLDIARERGVAVRVRSPSPAQLLGCETWLTNALHGIRAVTAWNGAGAAPAPRAASWQAALARTARPLG